MARTTRTDGVAALAAALGLSSFAADTAAAQSARPTTTTVQRPVATAPAPDTRLLEALRSNPLTAPYAFAVGSRPGGYTLSGRVGSKQVHDAAIQTAIALGIPVRDDLTIDTRVAVPTMVAVPPPQPVMVFPPPLFGRFDDPLFGLEPPLLTFPAGGVVNFGRDVAAMPAAPAAPAASPSDPPIAAIDLTVDENGVATLRGTVASTAVHNELIERARATPGVTRIVDELRVDPTLGGAAAAPVTPTTAIRPNDVPPPPPVPALRPPGPGVPAAPRPAKPESSPTVINQTPAADALAASAAAAIARRPALAGLGLKVSGQDGEVTIGGRVPSAYEAMLAFRAVQQVPGVRAVNDRLVFEPPDVDQPNPLRDKGRPDDLNPYLLAHVVRQLGDLAHVDRLNVRGDTVEVVGTVARADDAARVEAALRSIPLLRGFRLDPRFTTP